MLGNHIFLCITLFFAIMIAGGHAMNYTQDGTRIVTVTALHHG